MCKTVTAAPYSPLQVNCASRSMALGEEVLTTNTSTKPRSETCGQSTKVCATGIIPNSRNQEIFIDGALVARNPNNDDQGCNVEVEHTGDDQSKEEESIDSIIAETWARFTKKQKGRVWANYVTGYNDWQTDRLVLVEAFKEPFWNTEGLWTGRWRSSDPVGSCTGDGLNRVKRGLAARRHGRGFVDRHVVGLNFACGSAYALSGKPPKEEMDVAWRAGMRALALIF